jgi:predicted unusual protein kinase regulating ubiquinone biosynthesis (AarF/ABC1/UbiB family)
MSSPPDGASRGGTDAVSPAADEAKAEALGKSEYASGKRPDKPPTSRFGRIARLSALAPKALPLAAEAMKRALGVTREAAEEVTAREKLMKSAKSTAEAMLKTLGEMKGLPLKLGQMASYIDGFAPPGYEEKFQRVLQRLQQKAPPLSREAAVKVVREDLGAPPEEIFAVWDPDPFAAASIGQVHRATTKGGELVAVKVQYPGIDRAIENDLKSLSLLEMMVAPVGRRYHSKEGLEEVKSVFLAELDYAREADTADIFRKIHQGDDAIVVPRVHHSLTSRRVLTCELIGGVDYATFCEQASQAEKDAAGQTIWRFMFKALFRYGLLYADPHPGNYRFLGGERVAFLDFGCAKKLPPDLVAGMKRYVNAAADGDWDEFYRACAEVLGYDPKDPDGWHLYTEYTKYILRPLTIDGLFKYSHESARENVAFLVRNGKKLIFRPDDKLPNLPMPIHLPHDMTFVSRLQWGLASVLAGLGAEANWRRITDPWLRSPQEPLPH